MPGHKTIADLYPINSKCPRCSLCKFPPLTMVESKEFSSICPSYMEYKYHSHSGGGRVIMALSLHNQRGQITEESRRAIFQCTLCGGCDMVCKYSSDIEILDMLYALRAESFKRLGPLPEHAKVLERLEKVGHPLFVEGGKSDWLTEANIEKGMYGNTTLLWVGDRYALQKERRLTLISLVRLLQEAQYDFGVMGDDEPSTGRVALDIGDQERFKKQAQASLEMLQREGVQTVVCADAEDYNAFRAHMPKIVDTQGITVVHAVEVLADLVHKRLLKPRKKIKAKIAYHDPCSLGRLSEQYTEWLGETKKVMGQLVVYDPPRPVNRGTNGCYEPPRALLRAIPGVKLVEFQRRKEYAFCCGGEGMAYSIDPEFVNNTALHRMSEAKAVGAEVVATACPNCESNLGWATDKTGIPVKNVIDLLAESVFVEGGAE